MPHTHSHVHVLSHAHHARQVARYLLAAGASPLAINQWSTYPNVLAYEVALAFYYMKFGGLENRANPLENANNAHLVLGVMKRR